MTPLGHPVAAGTPVSQRLPKNLDVDVTPAYFNLEKLTANRCVGHGWRMLVLVHSGLTVRNSLC